MSKFIDAVTARWLGKARPIDEPLSVSDCLIAEMNLVPPLHVSYTEQNQYEASVHWLKRFWCNPKDTDHMTELVTKDLKRAIYGQFIEHISELDRALYEGDLHKAREQIRIIWSIVE